MGDNQCDQMWQFIVFSSNTCSHCLDNQLILANLFQHGVYGDVRARSADAGTAVNDDRAAFGRIGSHRLPDVGEDWQRVAGCAVVWPAGVVKLLYLALTHGSLFSL